MHSLKGGVERDFYENSRVLKKILRQLGCGIMTAAGTCHANQCQHSYGKKFSSFTRDLP